MPSQGGDHQFESGTGYQRKRRSEGFPLTCFFLYTHQRAPSTLRLSVCHLSATLHDNQLADLLGRNRAVWHQVVGVRHTFAVAMHCCIE